MIMAKTMEKGMTFVSDSTVKRADALLDRWGWPSSSSAAPSRTDSSDRQAAKPVRGRQDGARRGSPGKVLLRPFARGYVALSAGVQAVAQPVQRAWQESLDEARRAQEQEAGRAGGPQKARRKQAQEKQGEGKVKKGVGATAEAAGTAADAAA